MIAFALAAALMAEPPASSHPCAYDKVAMLAMPADKFDQDLQGGWRPLANKPECRKAVADLLAAYRDANWGKLKPGELHINYWHEGQMRAYAGDYRSAIRLLLAGENPEPDDGSFAEYAIGSVAFLNHDLAGLKAARDRLAKQPAPANWSEILRSFKAKFNYAPAWPMNLDVLDRLITCFDSPYSVAYEGKCPAAMAAEKK